MSTTAELGSKHEHTARQVSPTGVTTELGLYGLFFGLALVLRLMALGRWPLLDQEAGLALAAWRFARGLPASLRGHSPLLFHANTVLFFLTSGSDGLARSWCLLVGSLMVLLPYGLRARIGRIGALGASLLLAISPSFVYFSRSVDGSIVVAFCALALLVVLADHSTRPRDGHLAAAVGLLVLALLAAPTAYTLLAALLAFPLFLRIWARFRTSGPLDEFMGLWERVRGRSQAWRSALNLALVLMLGGGLAFAFNVAGLQMTLDQLGQWLGAFRLLGGPSWYLVPLLLLLYEGLPLVFGLAGFFLTRNRSDVWSALVHYWFVFVLLFSVVQGGRPPSSVLLVVLPLILAAGWALERLGQELLGIVQDPWLWTLLAVSLLAFGAAYVQLVHYLSFPQPNHVLRMAALTVFLLSSYALVWSLSGARVPLRAAALSLLVLLLLVMVRNETRLNYARARDAGEPMVAAATSPEVLELAQEAARLSSQLEGDERVLPLQVDDRLEVPLGWYLRGLEQVSYVSRVAAEPEAGGVVTLEGAPGPAGFVGLRFGMRSVNTTLKRSPMEWLRWWVGYKPMQIGTQSERVVLWVRQPLP